MNKERCKQYSMMDNSVTSGQESANASSPARLFSVADRGAVVTGAASGLGLAMARVLARNGARVTLLDNQTQALASAVGALAAEGLPVRGATADVTDAEAVDAVMRDAAAWETGLDIVFANAGISAGLGAHFGNGGLASLDVDRWRAVLEVNLTGTMTTVRTALPYLNDGNGRIVITSSIAGLRTDPLVGQAYSASKAAVTLFAQNTAGELAPRGINVNVIAPGSFLTEIGAKNPANAEMLDELRQATATQRLADPAEIEGLSLLLASDAARHITGAVYVVDGGAMVAQN